MARSRGIKTPVSEQCTIRQIAQLLVDVGDKPNYVFKDFLAFRPELYGGATKVACRNRCAYTRKLFKENPEKFWLKRSSKESAAPGPRIEFLERNKSEHLYRDKPNEEEDDDGDDNEDDEDEDEDEEQAHSNRATMPPPAKATNRSSFQNPIPEFVSPAMSRSSTSSRGPTSRLHATPMKGRELFGCLDDAIMAASVHHNVDFAHPERHGAPTFFLQFTEQVPTKDGKELYQEIKIWLNDLPDLRDHERYQAQVVCQGRAILVTLPAVPFFRRNLVEVNHLFKMEGERCENSENSYTSAMNAIMKDPERSVVKHLFELPEDMIVTSDLDSDVPPRADEKADLRLRRLPSKCKVGKKLIMEQNKIFIIGYWRFRVVTDDKVVLCTEEEEARDELESMFSGMKTSGSQDEDMIG
jgi:hypothetical protein